MSNVDFGIMKAKKKMRQRRDGWILRGIKKTAIAGGLFLAAVLSLGVADGHPWQLVEETYTVQRNDTLWSIGEEYIQKNTYGRRYLPEFIEGIKQSNEELVESHGQVYPGQKLRITYWVAK